jgi:putative spermidine/putrescine transport system substrate-binding protein
MPEELETSEGRMTRRHLVGVGATGFGALLAAGSGASAARALGRITSSRQRLRKKPSKLTVRVWSDPWRKALADVAGKSFTRETGIPLVWDTTDEGPTQTKIQTAIRSGQRPPVDVVWNLAIHAYLSSVQKLITPLDQKLVPNLKYVNRAISQPPDHSWNYVAIYSYLVPFLYRVGHVEPTTIRSWEDLFSPKFRKRISICDDYQCTAIPLAKVLGINPAKDSMDPVWKKLHELRPNLAEVGTDSEQVTALKSGQADVAVALIGDGVAASSKKNPVKWVVPREGGLVDRDALFVVKGIPEESAYYGNVFINHVLAPDSQAYIAKLVSVVPVNLRARLPAFMRGNPAFPFTPKQVAKYGVVVPTDVSARHQTQWQAAFDQAVK